MLSYEHSAIQSYQLSAMQRMRDEKMCLILEIFWYTNMFDYIGVSTEPGWRPRLGGAKNLGL